MAVCSGMGASASKKSSRGSLPPRAFGKSSRRVRQFLSMCAPAASMGPLLAAPACGLWLCKSAAALLQAAKRILDSSNIQARKTSNNLFFTGDVSLRRTAWKNALYHLGDLCRLPVEGTNGINTLLLMLPIIVTAQLESLPKVVFHVTQDLLQLDGYRVPTKTVSVTNRL